MNTDLLLQGFQYVLGVIPGDIAGNIVAVVTAIVTLCTLMMRFWKEPEMTSKWHSLWQVIHVLASFKKPDEIKENKDGQKDR
ncbi:hypothetical protein [Commensalibacter papalotli (ex Servin-Garciduenas et al. 2014)]|uniref:Holin n=1 Tax=Commensalibacter papalotli (ex Servin-Garciduenas et al. 2014) TaxID=1208583 RepID=W7DNE7_9PROT|nr:hypothetical protein [Commensalibacter papalotli (ex Servin-Garciduenas et al. 2014)]EUK18807.1 hypothetical protein COMX_03625 [Commensalibacter papalotli (ex Servin-Garciduenas et al. 2014)]